MSQIVLLRVDRVNGSAGHPRHLHPALDLKYLQSGLMQAGAGPAPIVDGWLIAGGPAAWVARVMQYAPRMVAIKGASWCLAEATACAAALKQRGVTTIAIGQQVEHRQRLPHAPWQDAFDIALLGEPEQELPRCVGEWLAADALGNELGKQQTLQRYWQAFAAGRRFQVDDPLALYPPQFSAAEIEAYPFPFPLAKAPLRRWGYVMTAWGCPHACLHCTAIVRKSAQRGLQKRPARDVADEVAALLEQGVEAISFEDDTLLADRRHFLALCDEFARRRLDFPWLANARPDELDDTVLQAMAGSGGRCLKIGVESGVPRLIEALGKAKSGQRWIEQSEAGFAALHRHGLASVALFMVGLPGEAAPDVEQSIELALRLAPDYVQVQKFTRYPDIALWDASAPGAAADDLYHYGARTGEAGAAYLARMQGRFYRRFYLRPRFGFAHAVRYWRHYLHPAAFRQAVNAMAPFYRGKTNR